MSGGEYRLRLKGLRLTGRIGVAPHEMKSLQELVVDIRLGVSRGAPDGDADIAAGIPESPSDIVCYDALAQRVKEAVDSRHWPLVEDLAEHLAQMCLADGRVRWARVAVRKPAAVANASWAGAEITLRRDEGG